MTAVTDFIADLQGGKYSDADQNLIAKVAIAVLALQQLEAGAIPASAGANTVLAGPNGAPGAPAFRALVAPDINGLSLTLSGLLMSVGATFTPAELAGIVGTTTNNDAQAGRWGEFQEVVVPTGGAIALVTSTPKDMCTLALTAGDWMVGGQVTSVPAATTTQSILQAGLSSGVANTLPPDELRAISGAAIVANVENGVTLAPRRFSLAGPTTLRLVVSCGFAISTLGVLGFMNARRVR